MSYLWYLSFTCILQFSKVTLVSSVLLPGPVLFLDRVTNSCVISSTSQKTPIQHRCRGTSSRRDEVEGKEVDKSCGKGPDVVGSREE